MTDKEIISEIVVPIIKRDSKTMILRFEIANGKTDDDTKFNIGYATNGDVVFYFSNEGYYTIPLKEVVNKVLKFREQIVRPKESITEVISNPETF